MIVKTLKNGASNRKTMRKSTNMVDGWKTFVLKGTHYEMGLQHGRLLKKDLNKMIDVLTYLVKKDFKTSMEEYTNRCLKICKAYEGDATWSTIFEELKGIADGSNVSFTFLIAWNMYLSMNEIYESKSDAHRCSAFIATGSKTQDGKIIMAHNTHCDYGTGFLSNVVLYMFPENGVPFVMQTIAGLVCSSTDWFMSSAGIVGCETTISKINYKPDFQSGVPYFFRIRKAMEFGKTLDDYIAIMLEKNAGDYACSWLLGDINSGEIMRLELGKKTHGIARTFDGYFYGMNSAFTTELVNKETEDKDMHDANTSSGSRNLRLNFLLNQKKITLKYAKEILADHYDHKTKTFRKGIRGICKHKECEKGADFKIAGAVDGKVVDSTLARQMKFIGRMGSSCGRVFNKSDYPDGAWKAVTQNMPKHDWVVIHMPKN